MKKLHLATIAVIFLVLMIPVAIAEESNAALETQTATGTKTAAGTAVAEPYQACVDKHKEASDFANTLDSDVIGALESIAAIAYSMCQVNSAIDQVINTVASIIGMFQGNCCKIPLEIERCQQMDQKVNEWKKPFKSMQVFCCFVNCGWCTGAGCGKTKGIDMSKITLGAIPPVVGAEPVAGVKEITSRPGGIGQFHLSPYDNIYTAVGCMCPTAILMNLRKLKTIYQTYDCCVEQSCAAGQSTEVCEHYLDTATCMYWEGSLYKMLVNVVLSIAARFVGKLIPRFLLENKLVNCLLVLLDIWQTKDIFNGVKAAMEWVQQSFNEPTCEDLGFESVEDINKAKDALKASGKDTEELIQKKIDNLKSSKGFYFGDVERPKLEVSGEKDLGYFIQLPIEQVRQLPGMDKLKLAAIGNSGTFVATANQEQVIKAYPDIFNNLKVDYQKVDSTKIVDMLKLMKPEQMKSTLDIIGIENLHSIAGREVLPKLQQIMADPTKMGEAKPEDIQLMQSLAKYYNDKGVKDFKYYLSEGSKYSFSEYLKRENIKGLETKRDEANQKISAAGSAEEKQKLQSEVDNLNGQITEVQKTLKDEGPKMEMGIEKFNQLNDYIKSQGDPKLQQMFEDFKKGLIDQKAIEAEIEKRQKKFIEDKVKDYIIEQARYEIAYQLLSMTLGNLAYDYIADKCEGDWESSTSESDTARNYEAPLTNPSAGVGATDNTADETTEPVEGDEGSFCKTLGKSTSVASQVKKSEYTYQYSYSITACKNAIRYKAYLTNSNGDQKTLGEGNLAAEQGTTQTDSVKDGNAFTMLCVGYSPGDYNALDTVCFRV